MQPVCSRKSEADGRKIKSGGGKLPVGADGCHAGLFALANRKGTDEKIKSGGEDYSIGADGCHAGLFAPANWKRAD